MLKSISVLLFLMLWLSACQPTNTRPIPTLAPTPTTLAAVKAPTPLETAPTPALTAQNATPDSPHPTQTDTPTATLTPAEGSIPASHISPAVVDEVWWSLDGGALFYRVGNTIFQYDIRTQDKKVTGNHMSPQEIGRAQAANLAPGESYISTSPSGRLSLYLFGTEPSPTPHSHDGEVWLGGYAAQLRLRSSDEDRVIADMPMCEFSAQ